MTKRVGKLVTADRHKAEVLTAVFASVFTDLALVKCTNPTLMTESSGCS